MHAHLKPFIAATFLLPAAGAWAEAAPVSELDSGLAFVALGLLVTIIAVARTRQRR